MNRMNNDNAYINYEGLGWGVIQSAMEFALEHPRDKRHTLSTKTAIAVA